MPRRIFLPKDLAEGKEVVLVDGRCYEKLDLSVAPVDTFSIEGVFDTCEQCEGESSSDGSSSGCVDQCEVVFGDTGPCDPFSPEWSNNPSAGGSQSYDPVTGNWSVTLVWWPCSALPASQGFYYDTLDPNTAGAVITSGPSGPILPPGPGVPIGTSITFSGTSVPPTLANCADWRFSLKTFPAPVYAQFAFTTRTAHCDGSFTNH